MVLHVKWSGVVSKISTDMTPRQRRRRAFTREAAGLQAGRDALSRKGAQDTCAQAPDGTTFHDALTFAREALGFEPDPLQAELLGRKRTRRLLLNCTRQWGKSTVTAVLALYRAWS